MWHHYIGLPPWPHGCEEGHPLGSSILRGTCMRWLTAVLKTEYGIFEQGRKSFLEELALCIFPEAKAVAPKPKPESKGLVHCQNKGQWPLEK